MDLTLEEKASLCLGSDFWHTAPVPRAGIPAITLSDGPHGLRKQPDEGDHVGIGGSVPATCFPTAVALALVVGPRAGRRASGAALGAGGARAGRRRGPRPRHQHQALAAVRAQLRVPLRGPARRRRARRGAGARRSQEPGRRRLAQALRRQQPGDRPAARQRRRRRAHAARDLPARLRARRRGGAAVDGDVRLQQGQRHLRVRAPLAAHRGAARRVGLRRARRLRLGRGPRPRRGARRRARPRDAAPTSASATPRSSPPCAPASSTRRCSTRRSRACSNSSTVAPTRRRPRLRRTTPTTRSPARIATECAVLLKNDDALLPLEPAAGDTHRRDRRVRPHPALPGRRQLAGQPDPRRRPARRAARGGAGGRGGGVSPARSRTNDGARRPGSRSPRDHRRRLPRPARRRRVRGLRPHPHRPARRPARADRRRLAGSEPAARRRARQRLGRAALRLGAARRRRSSSAGSPGRRPAAPSPTCSLGAANPSGRLAETIPLRLEDNPSHLNFPGEARPLRYGEGVFVGYRGYDAHGARRQLPVRPRPLLHALRLRRPAGDAPTATASTSAAASPTPASAAARRSPSSTSATPPPPSLRPPRELKGFTKVDLEPGESTTVTLPSRPRATSPTGTAAGCSSPASSRSPSAPPRATCA